MIRLVSLLFIFCSISAALYGQKEVVDAKSNKTVAISYITTVVNNRKLNLVNDIFAPAYVFHGMDGKESHSIGDSSLISFLNYLFKAFPDLHYTVDNAIAENDLVALSLTATGTHKNEFLGYAASNNKVIFKEMFFFRFSNKKIVDGWGVVDVDGVKSQISKQK
jgi:predicted ester cyclase